MNAPEMEQKTVISPNELALLGGGHVAYVREISAEQAAELMDDMAEMPRQARLYALYAADGTCMSITDSRDAAVANAWAYNLSTVSVH